MEGWWYKSSTKDSVRTNSWIVKRNVVVRILCVIEIIAHLNHLLHFQSMELSPIFEYISMVLVYKSVKFHFALVWTQINLSVNFDICGNIF